jgi:pyridine nucleotide-disulfide oxidoreductase family protein
MKKLVLLGGGHAHLHVLQSLATTPLANVDITLVSPYERQVYSGMLPGWIAGHYQLDDCTIALAPLAKAARATFLQTACVALDPVARIIRTADGRELTYDVLSIDTGSVSHHANIAGHERLITIRPIEQFIEALNSTRALVDDAVAKSTAINIVVVGAGAGGVEIALALHHTFVSSGVTISLVSAANTLPNHVVPRVMRALVRSGVQVYADVAVARVTAASVDGDCKSGRNINLTSATHIVQLADGRTLPAHVVIAALGAKAASWPRAAGLQCDDAGYILVNSNLQSCNFPNVFAAGDCASMVRQPRPKSGVYAVRAGPPLVENLRRALRGESFVEYTPQRRSLYLLATGRQHAIAAWGGLALEGDWIWRWKNRIDRAFVAKYKL